MDKGIDYSMGSANLDKENGIHYGVISQHSIMGEAMDSFEYDYLISCPHCGEDKEDKLKEMRNGKYKCLSCKKAIEPDNLTSDEPAGFHYENEGYQIIDCLDTDLMILKSPYYTFAQFCSPCVPGAGNLDTPIKDGVKTYALGHDWFENEKAPYPLYDVKTEKEIIIIEESLTCSNCQGSGKDTVKRIAEHRGCTIDETRQSLKEDSPLLLIANDDTFECWKCQGSGSIIEKKEKEI